MQKREDRFIILKFFLNDGGDFVRLSSYTLDSSIPHYDVSLRFLISSRAYLWVKKVVMCCIEGFHFMEENSKPNHTHAYYYFYIVFQLQTPTMPESKIQLCRRS